MASIANDTIDNVVEGEKPVLNLNTKGKSRVYLRQPSTDKKADGRGYKLLLKPGQKYYDMPKNWINQQIALLYGINEAPKRGAAVNRLLPYLNGQTYQHRQIFAKTGSYKILGRQYTIKVKKPVPQSSRLWSGKGDYESWN